MKVVEIEVCERLMDYRNVPDFKEGQFVGMRMAPKFHAQIKDDPGFWGCGDSRDEAIGSLIASHPKAFSVVIKHLEKLPR